MSYIPKRNDVVWIAFDPQKGREQAGRRPGVVLSPESYNQRSGLVIVCPVTTKSKVYPFEVPLPSGLPVSGIALADHVKSLDWRARKAQYMCQLPPSVVELIRQKVIALLVW